MTRQAHSEGSADNLGKVSRGRGCSQPGAGEWGSCHLKIPGTAGEAVQTAVGGCGAVCI